MCEVLDDPTGNSFVENPFAPVKDDALNVVHYVRTRQQDVDIGCVVRSLIADSLISINYDNFLLFLYLKAGLFRFLVLSKFKVLLVCCHC